MREILPLWMVFGCVRNEQDDELHRWSKPNIFES
jgi:hypothetical protein